MHELGVVNALVEQLRTEVERLGVAGKVTAVNLKLGALTTFVPAAMTFYFEALTKGTELEGVALAVEEIPVAGKCGRCGATLTLEAPPFLCAACGSPDLEIVTGRELLIDSLEVKDDGEG
ncbi:MAG TPA: hydrogenase maturation nickel metallochaperone HypA [bacterium]|nr:hydrogenase maturation nickel metallochaperone HypA [bacterium]